MTDGTTGVGCRGPRLLAEADAVDGRTRTWFPNLRTDVRDAGGERVDEAVVTDGRVVTSRGPADRSTVCETTVEVFADAA